jgi:4-hydroxy-tetrahydrodipicolinate reductase
MNIALVGYGKMGHAIEAVAKKRGHNVVLTITSANKADLTSDLLRKADVAIEFTRPDSALEHVLICLNAGIPVLSGTTGWNTDLTIATEATAAMNGAFLHASNFSIGVNMFFEVNKLLAKLMNGQPEYKVSIEETHHTHKKDAPSGTAITIAEQIVDEMDVLSGWALADNANPSQIPITAHRIEHVPGTHIVTYSSAIDDLQLSHTAHSRDGFALGAVLAAEFLVAKKGVFTMKDVLGI